MFVLSYLGLVVQASLVTANVEYYQTYYASTDLRSGSLNATVTVGNIASRAECAQLCLIEEKCIAYQWSSDALTCVMGAPKFGTAFPFVTDSGSTTLIDTGFLNYILLIGGIDEQGNIKVVPRGYDVSKWSSKLSPVPSHLLKATSTARAFAAAGVIGKTVIICGGQSSVGVTNTCERLTADRSRWRPMSSMNQARARAASYNNGAWLIVMGGRDMNGTMLNTAEKYVNGEWKRMSNIPYATEGSCLVNYKSKWLLLMGGKAEPRRRVKYRISKDEWETPENLPFDLVYGACLAVSYVDDCYQYNYVKGGGIFRTIHNVYYAEDCQLHCQAHPDCAFFLLRTDNDRCYLKDTTADKDALDYSGKKVFGPRVCPTDCYGVGIGIDTASPITDWTSESGPLDAQRQCAEAVNCNMVEFEGAEDPPYNLTTASNKLEFGLSINNFTHSNRVLIPVQCRHDCLMINVTYYDTYNVGTLSSVSDVVACQKYCQADIVCHHFSYHLTNQDCNMYGNRAAIRRKLSAGYVAGPKYCDDSYVPDCYSFQSKQTTSLIKSIEPYSDFFGCREQCEQHDECEAYFLNHGQQICRLISSTWADRTHDAMANWGYKGCTSQRKLSLACTEFYVDYEGHDIQISDAYFNFRDCMRGCQLRALCKFWSFDAANKKCFMKDGRALMGRKRADNIYSGPRECDDNTYSGCVHYFKKFDEEVVLDSVKPVGSWQLCKKICITRSDCLFFTYQHYSAKCTLMGSGTSWGRYAPNVKRIIGKRTCPTDCFHFDIEYSPGSHVVDTLEATGPTDCQKQCVLNVNCEAFVFTGPIICELKSSGAEDVKILVDLADKNVISGPKTCGTTEYRVTRIFVVGGGSTRLRLGTRSTQTWREAAILPYGANHTVYHAAIHARDGRVFVTGGFKDQEATIPVDGADKIFEYMPTADFMEVGSNVNGGGGAVMISVPKMRDD